MSESAGRVLLIPKGAYDGSATYSALDVVSYGHNSYVAKQATTGNLPTDTTYWQILTNVTADASPTSGSRNLVESGGVYSELALKANTADLGTAAAKNSTNAVTENSTDLVESGAVYTADKGIYAVMGQNGAVNLAFPTRAAGSVSSNGVTFSLDGLGRATANNTATANVRLDIAEATLKAGVTYTMCEPSSLQSKRVSNVDLCVYAKNKSNGTWRLQNNGPRPYYTPSEDEVVSIGIAVPNGTQLTNEEFAPMLVLAGVDVGDNFYIGAKSNRELTEDISSLNSGKLSVIKENTPNWHHTANITCDVNSGGLAYLFTNVGILLLITSSNSISMRAGLALQSDTNTYFKTSISGLTAEITAWAENTFETSKNCIWSLVPISGTWTMTF